MSHLTQDIERAALRGISHALPERLRRIVDLIAEEVPPTPTGTIAHRPMKPSSGCRRSITSSC